MSRSIPDKQFFKIGEVSRIAGVKAHVLRYWESEFRRLRPEKTRSNQRVYRRRDVELLLVIKQLLYQDGFTIAGANRKLDQLAGEAEPSQPELTAEQVVDLLGQVRQRVGKLARLVEE